MNEKRGAEDIIVGPSLANLKTRIATLAKRGESVLLIGEPGTGKELFAQLYAQKTGRPKDKIVSINCAEFPENAALTSELFGHTKGSFTGAIGDRNGIIREHNKGVIFLDELGHAQRGAQASLLRFLTNKLIKSYGADRPHSGPVDILIVAASSNEKTILPELRDRFRVLYLPPLRERGQDVYFLVASILDEERMKITEAAMKYLAGNVPDGNIRVLKRKIQDACFKAQESRKDFLELDSFGISRRIHRDDIMFDSFDDIHETYGEEGHLLEASILRKGKNKPPLPIEDFLQPWTSSVLRELDEESNTTDRQISKVLSNIDGHLDRLARKLDNASLQSDGPRVPPMTFDQMQKDYFANILKISEGNQARAAALAGLSKSTLRDRLKRLGILPTKDGH